MKIVHFVGAAVVLAASLVTPAASALQQIDETASDCSSTLPLDRVTALLPDGRERPPVPGDGLARKYYFTENGVSDITQIVPPPGWTPLAATAQELPTYGFPARPTDPLALQEWVDEWSHWRASVAPGMCRTAMRALGSLQSPNWAGGMNSGTVTYTQARAKWYLTAFRDYCTVNESSYLTWAGIGGWNNTSRLLQAGTKSSFSSLNGVKMWWEAISEQWDTHITEFGGT